MKKTEESDWHALLTDILSRDVVGVCEHAGVSRKDGRTLGCQLLGRPLYASEFRGLFLGNHCDQHLIQALTIWEWYER